MDSITLTQANSIIRGIPGNTETEITFENTFDKQIETMQRAHDSYGIMPESKFHECLNFIHNTHLIYLGHVIVNRDGEKYLREIYVSHGKSPIFYEILLQKEAMLAGNVKFNPISYAELIKTVSVPYIQDSADQPISLESAFEYDDVDDYTFATEADMSVSVTDEQPGETTDNNAGVEDITKTTAQAVSDDPSQQSDDSMSDPANQDDNQDSTDVNDDQDDTQAPDIMDENEDDTEDNADDEGTASKRRIRLNMVKLHNIIKDSLEAMNIFTPDYGIDISRRYYKIRENLSTIDGILLRIINEQINDITVEELMKKYTTLCNIFDISVRAMRVFAEDYKSSLKKKH